MSDVLEWAKINPALFLVSLFFICVTLDSIAGHIFKRGK